MYKAHAERGSGNDMYLASKHAVSSHFKFESESSNQVSGDSVDDASEEEE